MTVCCQYNGSEKHSLGVEPRGIEALTPAVQRRHDTLLDLSGDYKGSCNC
jgi:hypothetical protein